MRLDTKSPGSSAAFLFMNEGFDDRSRDEVENTRDSRAGMHAS